MSAVVRYGAKLLLYRRLILCEESDEVFLALLWELATSTLSIKFSSFWLLPMAITAPTLVLSPAPALLLLLQLPLSVDIIHVHQVPFST